MYGLQQYIFKEIQTVTVAGNRLDLLDSFIESITIYGVEEGPGSDVMEYISITHTDGIQQVQTLWIRVETEVMAMK